MNIITAEYQTLPEEMPKVRLAIRNILINGPFKYLNGRFLYPFIYLVKSLPFYIPKA